jgi:ribosomal protein L24E
MSSQRPEPISAASVGDIRGGGKYMESSDGRVCFFFGAPDEATAVQRFLELFPHYLAERGKPRDLDWTCKTIQTKPDHPAAIWMELPEGWGVEARP